MKKYLMTILLTCLAVTFTSTATEDDPLFRQLSPALKYWLQENPLIPTEMTLDMSFQNYKQLHAFALDRILSRDGSDWKIYKVKNYDSMGNESPVGYAELPVNSKGENREILTDGYYFAYKGDPKTGPRIVVQPTQRYEYYVSDQYFMMKDAVEIYYAKRWETEAREFKALLARELNERNLFRNSVLEFTTSDASPNFKSFALTFMDHVEDMKIDWKDLILPKDFHQMLYENTEGFLQLNAQYREHGLKQKKGLLLYGPPGNGKSLVAQTLISSMYQGKLKDQVTMIVVTARHLSFRHAVKALFEEAARLAPCVIFMEDIDLLGIKSRDGQADNSAKQAEVLNEFLNAMDGVVDTSGLLMIGTTNKVDAMDSALTRSARLGMHLYFENPRYPERKEFFLRLGTKKAVWAEDVTAEWLAGETENLGGADIVEIISIAKQNALLAGSYAGEKLLLTKAFFADAIAQIRRDHGRRDDDREDLLPEALRNLHTLEATF
ncbi:MAG: AAA family ATPase [Bacteriovoracia bacterium]